MTLSKHYLIVLRKFLYKNGDCIEDCTSDDAADEVDDTGCDNEEAMAQMQEWINNVPGLGKKCLIKAEEIFCDSYSDMLCCDELKLFISECQLDADGMYSNTLQ